MIQRFRSKALKRFYERGEVKHIKPDHRETVRDILARLDASSAAEDMNLPGFRLHRLKGEYAGFWAGDGPGELARDFPHGGRPRDRR